MKQNRKLFKIIKNTLSIMCLIMFSKPVLGAPKCATPEHPDICAKLIQFLNKGQAAGLLKASEWDAKTEHFHLYDKDKWRIKVTNSPESTTGARSSYTYNILLQQTGFGSLLGRIEQSIEKSIKQGRVIKLNYNNQYAGAAGQATGPSVIFDQTTSSSQQPTEDLLLGKKPVAVAINVQPDAISIQHARQNHPNKQINKYNINQHFITPKTGNHLGHNQRAFMVDSDDKAWSCKISGMGARTFRDQHNNVICQGHVETLHFQSRLLAHIPSNNRMTNNRCLISVHK